jgi:glycosyltransferase involved in cell wall biosynthesis
LGDQVWLAQLQPASNDNLPPAVRRQKLLVINVFFAPQSVGGATRVAQDQVLEILQDHSDAYDVTVLCIDHDPWQDLTGDTLPLDIWHWHGARILRLAVPPRSWADIQDGRVESFCRQWFQDESFDRIHCHCCQVLTASPLVVARQLGIPYLITLHDGWWLSPELFLVSPAGRPIDPAKPFDHIDGVPTAEEKAVALERQCILAGILRAAQQRLAVSDPFRKLYEQAGVENIDVRENKFTPMPPMEPRPPRRQDDPLRICHVGGMAMHKGYHILRKAVNLLPIDLNLVFTVIDHRLEEGDSAYTSTWNGYTVRFIPPIAMGTMHLFYGTQDVLVAPSIWPESFGLVTREAISAGLHVIASNAGALAEPIKSFQSGQVVEPGDTKELMNAIKRIAQDYHKMS